MSPRRQHCRMRSWLAWRCLRSSTCQWRMSLGVSPHDRYDVAIYMLTNPTHNFYSTKKCYICVARSRHNQPTPLNLTIVNTDSVFSIRAPLPPPRSVYVSFCVPLVLSVSTVIMCVKLQVAHDVSVVPWLADWEGKIVSQQPFNVHVQPAEFVAVPCLFHSTVVFFRHLIKRLYLAPLLPASLSPLSLPLPASLPRPTRMLFHISDRADICSTRSCEVRSRFAST